MVNRSRLAVQSPTGSTTEPEFELTDEQWRLISDLFPYSNWPQRRTSSGTFSPLCRRHSLVASQWCSLERSTQPISIILHLLASPNAADHRADIYSIGAVIYEMLTGTRYQEDGLPPSRQGFPEMRMDEVVNRSLHRNLDKRYQRASHIDDDVTQISRTGDSTVILRETLPSTPEQVLRAWTDSKHAQEFLAPSDSMTTDFSELSPMVGGRFCLTMKGDKQHTARSEYCRVKFPATISFTWSWDYEPVEPNETQVTIRLRPTTSGTELLFIHERQSSRESRDRHSEGWTGVLGRLQLTARNLTP